MTWAQANLAVIPAIWVAGVFVIAICRAAARADQQAENDHPPADAPSSTN